jgi:hypothetical protein
MLDKDRCITVLSRAPVKRNNLHFILLLSDLFAEFPSTPPLMNNIICANISLNKPPFQSSILKSSEGIGFMKEAGSYFLR